MGNTVLALWGIWIHLCGQWFWRYGSQILILPSHFTSETWVECHGKSSRLQVRRCGSQAQLFPWCLNVSSPLSLLFLICILEIIAAPTALDFGEKRMKYLWIICKLTTIEKIRCAILITNTIVTTPLSSSWSYLHTSRNRCLQLPQRNPRSQLCVAPFTVCCQCLSGVIQACTTDTLLVHGSEPAQGAPQGPHG